MHSDIQSTFMELGFWSSCSDWVKLGRGRKTKEGDKEELCNHEGRWARSAVVIAYYCRCCRRLKAFWIGMTTMRGRRKEFDLITNFASLDHDTIKRATCSCTLWLNSSCSHFVCYSTHQIRFLYWKERNVSKRIKSAARVNRIFTNGLKLRTKLKGWKLVCQSDGFNEERTKL